MSLHVSPSDPYNTLGPLDASSGQSQILGGLVSLLQVPRAGLPSVGHKLPVLRGQAPGLWDSSLVCVIAWGVGVLVRPCLCLSQCLSVPFYPCGGGGCEACFQLFFSRWYAIGNCRLCVSTEEMSSEFSYAATFIYDHLSLPKTHFSL